MTTPYNKHDRMLERDLTNAERLESARTTARFAIDYLNQFIERTKLAADSLKEDDLNFICCVADDALNEAKRCGTIGIIK